MTDVLGIDEILIGERDRTDFGDIQALAASIAKDGLLHPIVVNDEGQLVAGGRRLEACKTLGWTTVPVTQLTFETAADMLSAEMAENTCRKSLTPVEAERARARRVKILAPEAERREKAGIRPCGNVPQGKTRDIAAAGTGYSGRTLDKVAEVREVAEDDGLPGPIREVARQQLTAMDDGTTNPTAALRAVDDARTSQPAARDTPARRRTARRLVRLRKVLTAVIEMDEITGEDFDDLDNDEIIEWEKLVSAAEGRIGDLGYDFLYEAAQAAKKLRDAEPDELEQATKRAEAEGDPSRGNVAGWLEDVRIEMGRS